MHFENDLMRLKAETEDVALRRKHGLPEKPAIAGNSAIAQRQDDVRFTASVLAERLKASNPFAQLDNSGFVADLEALPPAENSDLPNPFAPLDDPNIRRVLKEDLPTSRTPNS